MVQEILDTGGLTNGSSSGSLEERRKEMYQFGTIILVLGYEATVIILSILANLYFSPDEIGLGAVFGVGLLTGTYFGILAWHVSSEWKEKGPGAACASGSVGFALFAIVALFVIGDTRLTVGVGVILVGPMIMAIGFRLRRRASRLQ